MILLVDTGIFATADAPGTAWSGTAERAAELSDGWVAIGSDGRLTICRGGRAETHETGLALRPCSLLVRQESPLELLIGTEPPHLFHWSLADGLVRNEAFAELPCRSRWHTPWGGPPAVRSLASPDGQTVYADIHVGSIMRSLDGGSTWAAVTPTLNEDVHRVAACPSAPNRVYANTARAVYVSEDRGQSWHDRGVGLGHAYGREVAVHPDQPDVLLATVSDGPHGENVHGRLWRSGNAGESWQPVGGEFPASTPDNIDTYHVTFDAAGTAWAAVGSVLYRSGDLGQRWTSYRDLGTPIRLLHARTATANL